MKNRFRILLIITGFLMAAGIGIISPDSAFSKTIYANVSNRAAMEPVMVVGTVVNAGRNGCRIKAMSESYRNDTIELNGKCPKNLKKGERVFGAFDGKNFVFMRRRGIRK